jgi:hypothetical protein
VLAASIIRAMMIWCWKQQAPLKRRKNFYHTTRRNIPKDSHFQPLPLSPITESGIARSICKYYEETIFIYILHRPIISGAPDVNYEPYDMQYKSPWRSKGESTYWIYYKHIGLQTTIENVINSSSRHSASKEWKWTYCRHIGNDNERKSVDTITWSY